MKLKTYQAYSMAEALAAVKRDLGADAVILNTRTFRRRGLLGLGGRAIVELTAAAKDEVGSTSTPSPLPAANGGERAGAGRAPARVAQRAYRQAVAPASSPASPAGELVETPTARDRERTRRLAQAMLEQHKRREEAAIETASVGADAPPSTAPPSTAPRPSAAPGVERVPPEPTIVPVAPPASFPLAGPPARPAPVMASVARRFVLSDPAGDAVVDSGAVTIPPALETSGQPPAPDTPAPRSRRSRGAVAVLEEPSRRPDDGAMREELSAIRQMVGEVLQHQVSRRGAPTPTMPERLFDMYLTMIGQEVSEELADQVINEVRDELDGIEIDDESAVRAAVMRNLAEYIPTVDAALPATSRDGRPLTIALIGPTGVGKTTTLAKLAASYKLRHDRKVALITADTYRIAAVDQLRTYANIIGLPLKVVLTPNEMRQAVRSLSDQDVILIDTAGRSQNDAERIDELQRFVAAAEPHEVHLVLSSTAGEKVLMREAEAFSAIGLDKVVLTKLDEAVSFGMLINVVRKIGKKLSFFTTGQEVPDQIEVSRPERLAELVLGGSVHA